MKACLLQRIPQVRTCSSFLILLKFKDEWATQNNVSNGKEMIENTNERSETEFASVKDPLKMQRTASNETTLVSEIPNIVNNENFIIASGKEKDNFNFK